MEVGKFEDTFVRVKLVADNVDLKSFHLSGMEKVE